VNYLHPFAELDTLRRNCVRLWAMDAHVIRKEMFVAYMEAYKGAPRPIRWLHRVLTDVPHPGWSLADRAVWREVLAWSWIHLTDRGKGQPTIRTIELPDEGATP
jgi:hypothetical protein